MTLSPRTPRKGKKRKGWLERRSELRRSRMKKRPKSKATMLRTHGTPEHRAWMKRQPCIVCGWMPSDAAHLKSGGTGRKDDWERTVPLCADYVPGEYSGHHTEYDAGKKSFRAKYAHLDLEAEAAKCAAAWLAHLDGAA